MLTREAYAYYEAGAAVAAVYLKLALRQVSINPARGSTDVSMPRDGLKTRMVLWLSGLAAEKKGVGETDPFRRMKCRKRVLEELAARAASRASKSPPARALSQAQDRANAICGSLFPAVQEVARRLLSAEVVAGAEVERIVRTYRRQRAGESGLSSGIIVVPEDAPVKRQES